MESFRWWHHFKNFHYIVLSVNIFIIKTLFLNSQTYTINDVFIVIAVKSIQLNWLRFFNMTAITLQFIAWVNVMMSYIEKIIISCLKHQNVKIFSILSARTFSFRVLYPIIYVCWTLSQTNTVSSQVDFIFIATFQMRKSKQRNKIQSPSQPHLYSITLTSNI